MSLNSRVTFKSAVSGRSTFCVVLSLETSSNLVDKDWTEPQKAKLQAFSVWQMLRRIKLYKCMRQPLLMVRLIYD